MNGVDKPDISPEAKEQAEKFKAEANELYKKQDFNGAIELYTKAIETNPCSAIYYANRSIANLKLENFGYALNDASKAIEVDRNYIKGYYRRAAAYMSLGKYKQALSDLATVTKFRPNDSDAKMKYNECNKIVKKLMFEKAIAVNDTRSIADSINFESMTIEDDYSGPALDNGKVTKTFMEELLRTYKDQKKLHKKYAYSILLQVKSLFEKQPTLVDINIPDNEKITVCGDIHGQFYDLLNIFEINGQPSETNPYLFNGDFVDRGSFSIECIFTLFGFKLLYPDKFFMARGNHESDNMNQIYGFFGECRAKYSSEMCDLFTEVYNMLPLAHCINKRILIMHGGLFSKDGVTLDDIRNIDRNRQPPEEGLMCELLWSDPQDGMGRIPSKRGVGIQFGPDVTKAFCDHNNLDFIIRSHEVKQEGYEVQHDGRCITVFSAPNYCDSANNKGAFIKLKAPALKPEYVVYNCVPHPPVSALMYAHNSFLSFFN
ncbi:unnamed protein product [Bemisia tabaci]|uniref:protein-serine/threonine phosphatase n=1 Tax=Bemisia tabaci TaxID=7038 RepID=A0AAI8Y5V3_BEMTA|nr:PREDICTED: serine/threonine-protein phosphatase 5 [Bemisia tabaci]CAH0746971.1 unnamed protein product [Bemisia tabaci]